jgi:hypothetical protein
LVFSCIVSVEMMVGGSPPPLLGVIEGRFISHTTALPAWSMSKSRRQ